MQQIVGPLNKDVNPIYQPQGSMTFCLNGVLENSTGMQGSILNEEGNSLCGEFTGLLVDFDVIGAHRLPNNDVLLFMCNQDETESVIAIHKFDCTIELLVRSTCLGFKLNKRISALSRTFNGCERYIYFTDTYNVYRSFSMDSLDSYLLPGETVSSANASGTGWACDNFKHFPDLNFPIIDLTRIRDNGGNLLYGSYTFTIRYLDDKGNATNWIPFSNTIPIIKGTVNSNVLQEDFTELRGTTNLTTLASGVTNGVDVTSTKSIELNITGIDTRFSYYQIGVIEYVTDLQIPTNYYILEQIVISGTTSSYIYSGFNPSVHATSSLNELTIPTIAVNTVHAHAQNAGRLFLANVKDGTRDWSELQRAVCKVTTRWEAQADDNFSGLASSEGTKRAAYYWEKKSFMRDEIYAFGIVFVLKDGTLSPPFHIPGTAADTTDRLAQLATFQANPHNRQYGGTLVDRQLLTVVASPASQAALTVAEADVKHLGLTLGQTVERWKVFNTAIRTSYTGPVANTGSYSHTAAAGLMSFWECENSVYPISTDCNGDYIYDEDAYGNVLAGTPVRHHKFPDTTLLEHSYCVRTLTAGPNVAIDTIDEIAHSKVGIVFENINIPASFAADVLGYYIVRVNRDETNKTVIDKGMFNNSLVEDLPGSPGVSRIWTPAHNDGFAPGTETKSGSLLSSNSLQGKWDGEWVRQAAEGSHLKFEHVWYAHYPGGSWSESFFTDVIKPPLNTTNREIVDSVLVASNREATGTGFSFDLYNNNWMNDVNFISVDDDIPILAVSGVGDPLQYRQAYYVSVKQHKPDLMGDLYTLVYNKFHDNLILAPTTTTGVLFGGDVFTNNFAWAGYSALGTDDPVPSDLVTPINDARFGCVTINVSEETINLALRNYGTEVYEKHPLALYTAARGWANIPINYAKADFLDSDTNAVLRQWKALNPDYSVPTEVTIFNPLPRNHNWCDQCLGRKPNFIYYSDATSAFDVADNYKLVRALNVDNVFPEDGPISGLFVNRDRLFATTPNSVIFLSTKPQSLSGDGTTVYTGTADVFSAPPKKLISTEQGYGGTEDKFSIMTCEFGTVMLDSQRGKVFLLTESLDELSNRGLKNWFRDASQFGLKNFIPNLDVSSFYTHVNGVGVQSVYDPKYRRLIIHKKDYIPTSAVQFSGELPSVPDADKLYYSIDSTDKIHWWFNGIEVFDSNSTYFENLSFTISYSFVNNGWVSWHSYMPNFMYSRSDTFFSNITGLSDDYGVYKHNDPRSYQKFYGTKFDHVLEFVAQPNVQTGVYPELEYYAEVNESIIASGNKFNYRPDRNTTFDRAWFYTETQSSDVMTIVPYLNSSFMGETVYTNSPSNATLPAHRGEVNWRLNKLRDVLLSAYGASVNDARWVAINSNYNQVNGYQGYLDYVPRASYHVPNNNMWSRPRFRDTHMFIRMFFNPEQNYRISTNIMDSFKSPSIR